MSTHTIPLRTPAQRLSLVGAVVIGAAPLGFGLFRYASTGWDRRMVWMALVATIFAGGVLASAIGKRRSRHIAFVQSAIIFVVGTLLAGAAGYLLGATSAVSVWGVAVMIGLSLGIASECIVFSRPTPGGERPADKP